MQDTYIVYMLLQGEVELLTRTIWFDRWARDEDFHPRIQADIWRSLSEILLCWNLLCMLYVGFYYVGHQC